MKLRGTPQEPVSWESPETWIEERLQGDEQALARRIWVRSGHKTNPRYLRGPGIVADRYDLIEEGDDRRWNGHGGGQGTARLPSSGRRSGGSTCRRGWSNSCKAIQVKPDARRGDLLPGWQ